ADDAGARPGAESALTLVGAVLANDDARRRVRLADRTGGPVLPPRRGCRPGGARWTATGVELVLAPGERRAIGYATPAAPVERPVAIASADPCDATATGERATETSEQS
ncbi:MAG: hypothetical protein ABEJ23_01885, partial [Haloarculaceae archaeon]